MMVIARLKAKNQLTIPKEVIKRLNLRTNELFAIDVERNFIKLIPVDIEPRYTPEELTMIDQIVAKEKKKAKIVNPGKEFLVYLNKMAK